MSSVDQGSAAQQAPEAEAVGSSPAGAAAVQGTHNTAPQVSVEADSADPAAPSDYDSLLSDTTSANSSIFDYHYENGRRYHAYRAGAYLLPNDETEQDRLDITHHVFRLALDGNLCATDLSAPKKILDIGTGTGIWAIEMGDAYPNADIVGTDLSPIQPTWIPPNVRFEVDDAQDEWTFEDGEFDFIHARTLAGSVRDWPMFVRKCYKHLASDGSGRVEIAEGRTNFWDVGGTIREDSFTHKWLGEWRRLAEMVQFDVFPKLPAMMEEAGFVDVRVREEVVPLGTWPKDPKLKELGRFFRVQFLEMGLEAYTMALFARFGGWEEGEIRGLLEEVKREVKEGKMHLYTFCSFVTARRPTEKA